MKNICVLFGKNIKKYRQELKISQEKLAEKASLHRTYISDIERGGRNISLKNVEKLAIALDVEVYELFIFKS